MTSANGLIELSAVVFPATADVRGRQSKKVKEPRTILTATFRREILKRFRDAPTELCRHIFVS
jgi:hypothetical protein